MTNEQSSMIWKKVLGILETQLNQLLFNVTFGKVRAEGSKEDAITLVVPNDFLIKKIKAMDSLVLDSLKKVAGRPIKYNLVIGNEIKTTSQEGENLGPLFGNEKKPEVTKNIIKRSGLSQKFRLDNFLIGDSNQLAHAIAISVTDNPGKRYNPFFLYSGVGLGKTHLVQAIGNKLLEKNPNLKVIYVTGESFTNELVEAIQSGKGSGKYATDKFRKRFREADVLLIDDIQFIVGRDSTQKEFFHTFNSLHMAEKQIVLTSDRPPKDFDNLEARITSRFGSGIIADIQPPDVDMREAILRKIRKENRDTVSDEILDFVARKVDTNIRELEGAYQQITTSDKKLTLENVEHILNKNMLITKTKAVSMNQILKTVCKYYDVRIPDIKGKRRTKDLVLPRQVAMFLIKETTNMPYMGIGDFLGGRDHTTIMHGVEKINSAVKAEGRIKDEVLNVRKML